MARWIGLTMRPGTRFSPARVGVLLATAPTTTLAAAQVPTPARVAEPSAPAMGGFEAALVILAAGLIPALLLFLLVRAVDRHRARHAEAVALEWRLADALLRDPRLAGLAVTPTAHVPFWRRSGVAVELHGEVPAPELRESTLRLVAQELAGVRPDARVEDRIVVLPPITRRVA